MPSRTPSTAPDDVSLRDEFIASARRMTRGEFYAQGHDDGLYLEDGTTPPDDEWLTAYGQHAFTVYEDHDEAGETYFHADWGNQQCRADSADQVAHALYESYVAITGAID